MNEGLPLPRAIEAEAALLGSILLDHNHFFSSTVRAEDFALESHQRIYATIEWLTTHSQAIDIVTLTTRLAAKGQMDSVGGYAYIASLTEGLPRKAHIEEYCRIIKEKAALRRIIKLSEHASTQAYDASGNAEEILATARAEWDQLQAEASEGSLESLNTYFARSYKKPEDYILKGQREQGVPFGLASLDKLTCGMRPGELIVIGARPGLGKTSCATTVADYVAIKLRKVVAFFSLEMPTEQLLDRMVCARAGVPLEEYRAGKLTATTRRYFQEALEQILEEPWLLVDDTSTQTVAQVEAKSQRVKMAQGLDLIIVDYLQLMKPGTDAAKGENREQHVAGIGRGLKAMAKKLGVPVIVLAQLNRELTKRADKRPVLSDLRETGSTEAEADVVILIHRQDYYEPTDESVKGRAELIVAKQRNGPTGTAHCFYREQCTQFYEENR